MKKYLEDKVRDKEQIKISVGLLETIIKLVLKKSNDNIIYYLKDQDIFCKRSELDMIARGMELAIRFGTEYKVPSASPFRLCKLNLLHKRNSALSADRRYDAEQDYEEAHKNIK